MRSIRSIQGFCSQRSADADVLLKKGGKIFWKFLTNIAFVHCLILAVADLLMITSYPILEEDYLAESVIFSRP